MFGPNFVRAFYKYNRSSAMTFMYADDTTLYCKEKSVDTVIYFMLDFRY